MHNEIKPREVKRPTGLPAIQFLHSHEILQVLVIHLDLDFMFCTFEEMLVDQFQNKGQGVAIFDSDHIEGPIILYKSKGTILLPDEEYWGCHRGFRGSNATTAKVLLDKCIHLHLFTRCKSINLTARSFGSRDHFNCMVPHLAIW